VDKLKTRVGKRNFFSNKCLLTLAINPAGAPASNKMCIASEVSVLKSEKCPLPQPHSFSLSEDCRGVYRKLLIRVLENTLIQIICTAVQTVQSPLASHRATVMSDCGLPNVSSQRQMPWKTQSVVSVHVTHDSGRTLLNYARLSALRGSLHGRSVVRINSFRSAIKPQF